MEKIKVILGVISGYVGFLLGGLDGLGKMILIMILLDIISGFMKGFITKSIESNKILIGGFRKIGIILVIFLSVVMDSFITYQTPLREMVIMYFIAGEGISFLENISYFTDLPEGLTKYFKNIKKGEFKDEGNIN